MNKTIRCINPRCNHGKGNILLIAGGDSIYIRHRNPEGNYFEKTQIRIPGLFIRFENLAISQSLVTHSGKSPELTGSKIFVQCCNGKCRTWNRLEVSIPGMNIDFDSAAIVKSDLPVGYHLDVEHASVVVV